MKIHYLAICIGSALLISACGGSSSGNADATPAPPVSDTPVTSNFAITGVITGFGSIYIDGNRFETDNSSVSVNGESSSIDHLKVGMNIKLSYQQDSSGNTSATSVEYGRDAEGIVDAIDRDAQTITIAGLVVRYNDQTHFIGTTVTSLSVGDRIEISGYSQQDGTIIASYIELDNQSGDDQTYLSGVVSSLNTDLQTFSIGGSVIDYGSAEVDTVLSDGITVKVEGVIVNGVIVASEVGSDRYDYSDQEYDAIEVEGLVTSFDVTTGILGLYGEQYTITSSTVFEDGSADTLAAGDYVELKIDLSSGAAVVTRIEVKSAKIADSDGKLKGNISEINQSNNTITVNGVVFTLSETTRYEDEHDQYFHFSSLQVSDYVEIVYFLQGSDYIVQRIEREREEDGSYRELESKGRITDVTATDFVVNGVAYSFADAHRLIIDDIIVGTQEFAAALMIGVYVEVEGYHDAAGQLVIAKIEIKNQASDDEEEDEGHPGEDDTQGYVEIESRVESIVNENAFMVNGIEVRLDENTEFEVYDNEHASLSEFMSAIEVGLRVDVEGVWVNGEYVRALKVEIDD